MGREPVVTPEEIAAAVDRRTRAIAVSHVGYLTGARHDLGRLRVLADRVGARLVVDASHALGVVPVDGDALRRGRLPAATSGCWPSTGSASST